MYNLCILLMNPMVGSIHFTDVSMTFMIIVQICIGYFEATRGYVIYSPRRALFFTLRGRVNESE